MTNNDIVRNAYTDIYSAVLDIPLHKRILNYKDSVYDKQNDIVTAVNKCIDDVTAAELTKTIEKINALSLAMVEYYKNGSLTNKPSDTVSYHLFELFSTLQELVTEKANDRYNNILNTIRESSVSSMAQLSVKLDNAIETIVKYIKTNETEATVGKTLFSKKHNTLMLKIEWLINSLDAYKVDNKDKTNHIISLNKRLSKSVRGIKDKQQYTDKQYELLKQELNDLKTYNKELVRKHGVEMSKLSKEYADCLIKLDKENNKDVRRSKDK